MGRPRRFDENALIDAAEELFWSRGFDGTSVEDVSAATGVGNGSIYAAYSNKMGLFVAVLDRYCDRRAAFVQATLDATGGSAKHAVRVYFDAVIADCGSHPDRRGCLMLNTLAHMGDRVPAVTTVIGRATQRMETAVAHRLRGPGFDELPEAEISALSAHVVMVSQGLIQLSRLGTSPPRLAEIAAVSADLLPTA
ncbi:TetR/AcrR family transcriptional regulator [Williamsia maris]|uniref:Transcriptional regulator, TetR family n=1 Tax=Williamsia maris TaxID=72806 RepID=A0ABT1HBL4_9NOCA|nr:TetR/AcrR family transcriptional regulator [Williamsia maris]MCP2175076.1 transcriptional regulator, TetR family [Williamsia maris]